MNTRWGRGLALLTLLVAAGLGPGGCAWFNKMQGTQITVMVPGDQLLHIAVVPKVLPDGTSAAEKTAELLARVAKRAGGYTFVEDVAGAWVPPGQDLLVRERNGLLLVAGPPELAQFLADKLREDFRQKQPFVVSLPIQAPVAFRPTAAPPAEPALAAPATAG